jgi:glycosyl transferase family WbsX
VKTRYSPGLMLALLLAAVGQALFVAGPAAAQEEKIGVYYFPGWKDNQRGAPSPQPWERIKRYPEREPLLGWYPEGSIDVMSQQLAWMKNYAIDYVVFDWLWAGDNTPVLEHALDAYLAAPDRHGVQFALLWANHTTYTFSKDQFEAMFRYWAMRYMARPEYLRIDGKPVVFIFSAITFNKNAHSLGMTSAQLMGFAENIFKEAGLPGISFVGGTGAAQQAMDYASSSGYVGYSAYNYHGPATFYFEGGRSTSHSYGELDRSYQDQWQWMLAHTDGIYVLPMTSGWDKTPWGGSSDPEHDKSQSTPDAFEAHLRAAKAAMVAGSGKTRGLGVICCWNEFGEGSYIEPTKAEGFSYLEKVQKVFGVGAR